MKKILLTIIGLAMASPAWAAQTAVTPITATQDKIGTLKASVNTKLGTVESNRQDHETRVAAMETGKETKAVIQASAPADTTVDWYDTDQETGVLILKRHNGTTWLRASSYGVQYLSNCLGISAGFCVDTDDGKLYYHNNTEVVEVGTGTGGTGDIEGVTASTGLTGGGTTGTVTLSVDPTYVQRRVSSSCSAGTSIRAIAEDGTVTCETDDTGSGTLPTGTEGQTIQYGSGGTPGAVTMAPLTFDGSNISYNSTTGLATVPVTGTATSGSATPFTSGGAYTALAGKETADPTIIKVAEIDTQAEFEALVGWTLPSGGTGGYVTAPVYSDSTCTAGTYSFHSTHGVVYCKATDTWDYQVVSGSSLAWASWNNLTPVTYAATLTITDASATGDTFTLNSIAYDVADSPVSVTDLPTATEQITYTGSNTAACTGDVTGTGPWTITDGAATVDCAVTTAALTSIFLDTFTSGSDVTLASHTSDSGGSWVKNNTVCSVDMTVKSSEGVVIGGAGTACTYYVANVSPPSPDYVVYANISQSTNVGAEYITARGSSTVKTLYIAGLDRTASLWRIRKYIAGTLTELGSAPATGVYGSRSLRMEISGSSSTIINLYVDDALTVTGTDEISPITTAGYAGIYTSESQLTTGGKMTDFEVKQ